MSIIVNEIMKLSAIITTLLSISTVTGLAFGPSRSQPRRKILEQGRNTIISLTSIATLFNIPTANAEPKEIVKVGQQETPPDGQSPFTTLSNGVQIKDFRTGSASGSTVQSGSKLELILKGRLLNLNGVIFYDTKSNDPNGFGEGTPLVFTVGDGSVLPGLESGLIGMSKGGIRRVIVPAELGYGKNPDLEPKPFTDMERRALDSVVKNPRRDGTVMFDVKVERVR